MCRSIVGFAEDRLEYDIPSCSERNVAMEQIVLDAEAGQISAELARRGVASNARVHALVEVMEASDLPMAVIAQTGKGFDWLADEPELYSDSALTERAG